MRALGSLQNEKLEGIRMTGTQSLGTVPGGSPQSEALVDAERPKSVTAMEAT